MAYDAVNEAFRQAQKWHEDRDAALGIVQPATDAGRVAELEAALNEIIQFAPIQKRGSISYAMRSIAREALARAEGDSVHSIHCGTEWEAELLFSDLQTLARAEGGR